MKTGAPPKRQRCVIYTRKSSDEGLDQEFNSLDAQREACVAYIASQAGEGWRLLPSRFDDGGYSGGNMERPALRQLMEAIDGGTVDVVVVYKVDRLTRSLTDFVRIVERFDAKGVSFVSVTQSFNTTTSMGRLTLNVLLSFAQFEREVTGERIRDKIAASKAKGLWMGGRPPLGYNPVGRTLEINAAEAETVRYIFARYLELGSVHDLAADLAARHIRSKSWTTRDGRLIESAPFARGALYYLLRNRLYLGEIVHKGVRHEGRHPAILGAGAFAAVQTFLDAKVGDRKDRAIQPGRSPLTGILFDSAGNRMSPSSTRGRDGKPHRYYVSKAVLTGRTREAGSISRVPAELLEGLVRDRTERILADARSWDWVEVRQRLDRVVVAESHVELTLVRIPGIASERALRCRLSHDDRIEVDGERIRLIIPASLKVGRGKTALINADGRVAIARKGANKTLAAAVARARAWREQLVTGAIANVAEIARQEGTTDGPIFHLIRLAYLSPDVTRAILAGRQRADLHLEELIRSGIPTSWSAQRRLFGLSSLDLPTTANAL